jgi:hypothetical protein
MAEGRPGTEGAVSGERDDSGVSGTLADQRSSGLPLKKDLITRKKNCRNAPRLYSALDCNPFRISLYSAR